ncbi:retinaldehyde-binding protein 1-like [Sycon ciliatum]|uniref:retinaldehyde-binding protein 1-like n=1 Tax=Sycon ciliatum TaxID=27933 RepID=UPI0020ACC5BB|eukprot:scpid81367/ scgid35550/ Retinaldehyde-binding protein 1; Cellular retinaldehyde-binding protein
MAEATDSEVPECWISKGLCEKSREKAAAELNETEERKKSALVEIREKIAEYSKEHPSFRFPREDDSFLVRFLRARKYDVERAFSLLINFTTYRIDHPELFEGVTLDSVRPTLEYCLPFILRDRDDEGRRVVIFQPSRIDPERYSHDSVQQAIVYALDALIDDEEAQVNGFILIEDYSNMTIRKILGLDQRLMKRLSTLFQDAYPARFSGMHFVNQPWFFSILWNIAKPFLKEKIRQRTHMHGSDFGRLHEFIPKRCLPAEVGGDRPPYSPDELLDFLSKVKVDRPPARQVTAL